MHLYKIMTTSQWEDFAADGQFTGAAVDLADGYIHFSTSSQVRETAARHFAGQCNLILVEVDAEPLGAALRWEPSRGGMLFPHLYDRLHMAAVTRRWLLTWDAQTHIFPPELGDV